MGRSLRHVSGFALAAFALVGCGGGAHQPGDVSSTLNLSSVVAYTSSATPVETTTDGLVVIPLAQFTAKNSSEELLVWGSRDANGTVTGVHETAITSSDASNKLAQSPLYARYGTDGGLVSLKDSSTSSSLTFAPLGTFTDSDGNVDPSIRFAGVDNKGKTASGTAYLRSDGGVSVSLDSDKAHTKTVSAAEIKAILAHPRDGGTDPLAGLATVDTEPTNRTKILTAVFKVASVVVDSSFKSTIVDTEGFVILSELGASYSAFLAAGGVPTVTTDLTTPTTLPAYRSDLPTP